MNPQLKWPLACTGTLVAGWLMGYVMGGGGPAFTPGGEAADRPDFQSEDAAAPGSSGRGEAAKDTPTAQAEEEKRSEMSLLGALRETNHLRRIHGIYDVVGKMSPREISSAIATAQRLPDKDRATLLPILVGKWAETDPQGAMTWVRTLPAGEDRDSALHGLAATLA